tara:strand:+ start:323 stop:724 length:402 start_codon:yes stop_codon:yes gene_type:complete
MNVLQNNKRFDLIESIIDEEQLTGLMDYIAEVCSVKADHIREQGGSRLGHDATADRWDGYAAGFLRCSESPDNLPFVEQIPYQKLLFRELSYDEELEFRQGARDSHKPGDIIETLWHPVYRDECGIIDEEAGL